MRRERDKSTIRREIQMLRAMRRNVSRAKQRARRFKCAGQCALAHAKKMSRSIICIFALKVPTLMHEMIQKTGHEGKPGKEQHFETVGYISNTHPAYRGSKNKNQFKEGYLTIGVDFDTVNAAAYQ